MKKILSLFLAFTPGVGPAMLGKNKLALLSVIVFWLAGWSYRAAGILGPEAFFVTLGIFLSILASLITFSIHDILRHNHAPNNSKGLGAWVLVVTLTMVGVRFLSPGNIFDMGSNESMGPIIKPNEFFYVTNLKPSLNFGDIVTYESSSGVVVGIVCGLPGNKVETRGYQVMRDDRPTDCGHGDFVRQMEIGFGPYYVPNDTFFLLKPNGMDSSITGRAIPISAIKGKMVFKLSEVPFANTLDGFYRLFL
jgi:hypothetical protein